MPGWPSGGKFYKDGDEMIDYTGATFKRVNGNWVMIKDKDGNVVEYEDKTC